MMLISALVLMTSIAALANKPQDPVKVVSKQMDVVYFKVSCDMIGASINVYDANGKMIHTDRVTNRKVLVDFYAEPSGAYTIHVVKNGNEQEIVYNKESASHSASINYVSVTQM